MTIKHLDRRTLLRGALATGAAVTIPLPLLDIMLNGNGTKLAHAQTALSPLYMTWFFGNGTLPGLWKPAKTGTAAGWELSPQLKALAEHKSYLTVASGLEGKLVVGGMEHPSGSAGCTTGAPLNGNAVRSESIDQSVAKVLGTPQGGFRSLELGVTPATPNGPQDSLHTVSHSGPNARNMPEYDPKAVFNRLFMGGGVTPAEPDQAAKMVKVRKSVLDAVLADGARLQKRLGAADKLRIERHLAAIRDIEGRLEGAPSTGNPAACSQQTAPTQGKDAKSEAPPGVNTIMSQLATLALACDRTRVVSYMFSLPAAHVYYRHLDSDMNADFHDTICHTDPGTPSNQPRVDKGVQYTMRCLAELLTSMKSTEHGDGNLLDASLIYVTSDTAWGQVHDPKEWPVLFIGKAGGRLAGDTHVNFQGEHLSRALLTVAQVMGSTATSYGGGSGMVTNALPGIQV
ncbi:MAG: DUF1552 domain-containing protein [Myxococcales bacterium]|nr:MAG: DUF1552 domain-containing protein [Myxococcales bacterium]